MKKTRLEAINAAERYYDTGKSCKHGHYSRRLTMDGSCVECRLINNRNQRKEIKQAQEQASMT